MSIIAATERKCNTRFCTGPKRYQGARIFTSPGLAFDSGYLSQSAWRKRGRVVRSTEKPNGVVITEQRLAHHGESINPILGESGKYLEIAWNWWDVYSEDQTDQKVTRGRGRRTKIPTVLPSPVSDVVSSAVPVLSLNREGGDTAVMMLETSQVVTPPLIKLKQKCGHDEPVNSDVNKRFGGQKKALNAVRSYVPEGLVLPDDCPCKPQIWYFLGVLYFKHLETRLDFSEPIQLKATYLRENIPEWKAVWQWCHSRLALVERDYYIKGEKCYGYRLTEQYRDQTHRLMIFEHPLLAKRQREARQRFIKRPIAKHLAVHLDRITVDRVEFERRFSGHPQEKLFAACLQAIEDRVVLAVEDDFSGRLHTNLTNLPRRLRSLLRVDGRQDTLGEIDIANSQPLFLGLAAQAKGVHDAKYMRITCEGRIYDVLAETVGMMRETAKSELLKAFYAKNGYTSLVKKTFAMMFPAMAAFIHDAKIKDHVRLARQMQRAERRFIIDNVCGRLSRLRPEMFLATIHDSVIAEKPDCEFIEQVLREEFGRLGISPRLAWRDVAEHD